MVISKNYIMATLKTLLICKFIQDAASFQLFMKKVGILDGGFRRSYSRKC